MANDTRNTNDAKPGALTIGRRSYNVTVEPQADNDNAVRLEGPRGARYRLMANKRMTVDGSRVYFAVDDRGFGLVQSLRGVWFAINADGSLAVIR